MKENFCDKFLTRTKNNTQSSFFFNKLINLRFFEGKSDVIGKLQFM